MAGEVVGGVGAEGAGAEGEAVRLVVEGTEDGGDVPCPGADARQAQQRAGRIVGVDGHADAGFDGGGHDGMEEGGEVGAELLGTGVAIAVEHAAQAFDVVAVEGAGEAGHDGGEEGVAVGLAGGGVPGVGTGENVGSVVGLGAGAFEDMAVEGGEFVGR